MRNWKVYAAIGFGLVAAGFAVVAIFARDQQPQKPVKTSWIESEFIEPPEQLHQAYAEASTVAVVKVLSSSSREIQRPSYPVPDPLTYYDVDVVQVFKSELAVSNGSRQQLVFFGGDFDRGAHIERLLERNYPRLKKDRTYLLFLRYFDGFGAWQVMWGPHGVYELDSEIVHTPGWSKLSEHLTQLTVPQLLSEPAGM